MKKTILTLSIIVIIAGTFSTSYGMEPDKKSIKNKENLQETKKNMVEAKQDLKKTHKYVILEYQKFMKDSELKIKNNKKCFTDFKVRLSEINQMERATCHDTISGLEQENNNLKNKLGNYKKVKGQDNWASFKGDFNNDMDKLEIQMWSVN